LVNLRKIYNSLKDGMSAVPDWFDVDPVSVDKGSEALKNKLKGKKKEEEAKSEPEVEAIASGPCPNTGEVVTEAICAACNSRQGCPVWE
jgi:hypothetical protein